MRILIGYDGSPGADAALEDLASCGLPAAVEAMVLTTAETWLAPKQTSVPDAVLAPDDPRATAPLALAERARARLRERFPAWQVACEACLGSPSLALIRRADSWRADLVVVGAQSRGTLGLLVLGSVAQKVVSEARTSVRIGRTRAGAAGKTPPRLLVAVDGSQGSEETVAAVAAREWPAGTQVRLLTATGPFPHASTAPGAASTNAPSRHEQEAILLEIGQFQERARATLVARGLEVSLLIKEGDPKHVIVSEADSWSASCVFVGSTGLSRFERLILGSVSAAIAPRASCSVEVVRPSPRA